MENDWYKRDESPEEVVPGSFPDPSPVISPEPAAKRRRRHTWIPWTIASVAVVALIALSSILFASRGGTTQPSFSDPDSGGEIPDHWEDYQDFQDYLESYFTPSEEKASCDIPRVEVFPGGELTLSPEGEELSLQEIYKRCAPSVVGIKAFLDDDSEDNYYWGTGIVMTADGIIVTNAHVISSNSQVPCRARVILYDDTEYDALLIGFDSRSDIALLKIDAQGLQPAEFGDTASMEVGDSVVAIGNPLREEFRNSMTEGIISGIDRGVSYNGGTMTLLQTTTPINEGNSGGPLINRSGQVIGITNMKMSARYIGSVTIEGVGFAIPSTTVKTVGDSIRRCGEMLGRPALGLTVGSVPDKAKNQFDIPGGLYISAVTPGTDCEAQGILPGDILLTVDGESVSKTQQVFDILQEKAVGDTLTLGIWRQEDDGGRTFEVTVRLMEMNDVY